MPNWLDSFRRRRYALNSETLQIEHVDVQERDRRADEEALRSGRKTPAQLKHENEVFALPPDRIRINLGSAHSLS